MTVIPFPKPRVPSPRAVDDFKRVCDSMGLKLADYEAEGIAAVERIAAMLDHGPPKIAREPPHPDEV